MLQRQVLARRLRLGVITALAVGCLIAIIFLAQEVRAKLAALQTAGSDNTQWVMMQTEVEVLRLKGAIGAAQASPSSERLDEVRRWFNVLYSRVAMLEQSAVYAPILTQPDYRSEHDRLRSYLDANVALIDASDTRLAAALDQIAAPLPDLRSDAREMMLNVLSDFAAQSDLNRESISLTLLRLALATGALLLIVAGVAAILALQFRRSEAQKRALHDTGARLSTIVGTSVDGIVVTDLDGVIREFNPAAEAIFGLSASALRGQSALARLLAEDEGGPQQQALLAALRDPGDAANTPIRMEVDARRADGSSFPAEVSIARAQITEAGLVVAFVRDISDRREAGAALARALDRAQVGERTKAQLLAVMSHEMRTPLNGLIGSMELLRRTTIDDDQRQLLSVMEASGDILLGHVNSVLDVSRAEAGAIHPDCAVFDLDRLLQDTVANQAGLAAARGNSLRLSRPSGPLGQVKGDAGRLRQILLNLIGNAVKFTHAGEIGVEADRLPSGPGDQVEIRVSDTGVGIAEADLDRIFDDFVTLDASYGRSAEGTGLGLGIARRLAQALGGEIGVESVAGEGSLFWLRLPLPAAVNTISPDLDPADAAPHATAALPADGDEPIGPPRTILLVEDNAINRFLLRRFLESGGHSVTEAVDGIEAVEQASHALFDLILMDISMPRMDGIAATRAIRASGGPSAGARILALTAHALPQELARFRAAGMDATLTKPIDRLTLLQTVAGTTPPDAPAPSATQSAPQSAAHAVSQATPTQAPPVDSTILTDLIRQIGRDMAQKLITRLIDEGDATIRELSALDSAQHAEQMAALCHRLSGSSGTFGTTGLRAALMAAETALKYYDHDIQAPDARGPSPAACLEVTRAITALNPIWQATRTALAAACWPEDRAAPPRASAPIAVPITQN